MSQKNMNFVSYGEVLFDVLESEKKIGGAPLNLALRAASFGFPVHIISAVGNDDDGKVIVNYAKENGLETTGIGVLEDQNTGIVQVILDENRTATYDIKFPSAWDFVPVNAAVENIVKNADVFLFGSLVCRNEVSKNTLITLLKSNTSMFKVFDVNLRPPYYSVDLIKELAQYADFMKLNDEELLEINQTLGFRGNDIYESIQFLSKEFNVENICVTKGKDGSTLLWKGEFIDHFGYSVQVEDTVGAGDSFLASLISQLVSGSAIDEALDFASAVGAIVAGSKGANPKISNEMISEMRNTKATV